MYAAQQQQLQHQSQPQPFFNQYSQQVPQNIQQPYIPPEQQNIPQQQYVPQNLHPQINTQAPYQNLQYKNPETPININILPEQSSNNI